MTSIEDSKDRDINNIRTRKLGDVDPKSGPESTACQLSSDKNVAALAVDDTGTTALVTGKSLNIFPVGESTEEKNPPRCDTKDVLSKLTDKIGNNPVQNEDLTCLSFSPDGKLLVVGTQGGSLHLLKKIDNNFDSIQFSGKADFKTQTNIVKDCAVSDKGTVVGGFGDGNVWLMWLDKEEDKSPQKVQLSGEAYQVRVPVKALSMDAKGKYVAVLSEWQPSGCTRSGLPGQSIRIWDLESKEPKEQVTPVSVQCFPNRRITTIGAITAPDNPVENMWLPVMFGEQLERVPCLACARPKESSDEVLERLRSEAKPLISKSIDEKGLLERYGIHL
jgi:WD40 repeat protein